MDNALFSTPYTYQWFKNQFSEARSKTIQFCQPIPPDIFVRRPSEKVWSVAECYNHLVQFGRQYLKNMHNNLQSATGNLDDPERAFPPRIIWKGIIKLFAPPYRMKMKTMKPFVPECIADLNKKQVISDFLNLQDRFIEELTNAQAEYIDLQQVEVSNPILSFVKMTLSECFAVVEVHQRRHMWQAEQILETLDQQIQKPKV